MATVVESLNLSHQRELRAWAGSMQSQLLWIDGCSSTASSMWTADLILEVIETAIIANAHLDVSDGVVVYHFCTEIVEGAKRTPRVVVQDWIFQLIGSRAEKFTQAICRKYKLTTSRFLEASKPGNFSSLWKLFEICTLVSEVRSLVLALSDLDDLYRNLGQCNEDIMAFRQLVDGLIEFSRTDKFTGKIIVTTKPSGALDYFSSRISASSHQNLLKLAAPPNRRRPPVSFARPSRISIEAAPLKRIQYPDNSSKLKTSGGEEVLARGPEIVDFSADDSFDYEDSDLDFSDDLGLDLTPDLDSDDGSNNGSSSGQENEQGETNSGQVIVKSDMLSVQVKLEPEHDEDTDDSLAYSDSEDGAQKKEQTGDQSLEAVEDEGDDLSALLSDSDDSS